MPEFNPISIAPLALAVLRQVMEFIAAERARTGLTYEEIFERATQQIDANDAALRADLGNDGPLPV
jgi:hypothetical protein